MDFLPTGLDDRLRIMGTLPEMLLIRMGMDVAAALAFAHREGVIHRDIKTDNILYDDHGNAIVADFGIARALSGYTEQTGTNMVVGTPQYFSPEQARGQTLDGRADIYSLGVTLFKAATGVLPFQGEDWYEIARQHIEEAPPRPRAFNPALSRGIEHVILKCLAKDPADRYPTGDALHTELMQLLGPRELAGWRSHCRDPDACREPHGARDHEAQARAQPTLAQRGRGSGDAHSHHGWLWCERDAPARSRGDHRREHDSTLAETRTSRRPRPGSDYDDAPRSGQRTGRRDRIDGRAQRLLARPHASHRREPSERVLRVIGPADAAINVDGSVVGRGTWHSENIASGLHHVIVSLNAPAACASAQEARDVRVGETGTTTVQLSPAPLRNLRARCGTDRRALRLSSGGHEVASGAVPSHPDARRRGYLRAARLGQILRRLFGTRVKISLRQQTANACA